MTVFCVIRAVNAAVDTVIGQIERRKHNDAVAVEGELDLLGEPVHLGDLLRVFAGEQHGCLTVGQTGAVNAAGGLFRTRLLEKTVDQLEIIFVALGVFERFENLLMVDKIISIHGFRVINSHLYYILSCSKQISRFYVAAVDDERLGMTTFAPAASPRSRPSGRMVPRAVVAGSSSFGCMSRSSESR